jgi:hypothetical protein
MVLNNMYSEGWQINISRLLSTFPAFSIESPTWLWNVTYVKQNSFHPPNLLLSEFPVSGNGSFTVSQLWSPHLLLLPSTHQQILKLLPEKEAQNHIPHHPRLPLPQSCPLSHLDCCNSFLPDPPVYILVHVGTRGSFNMLSHILVTALLKTLQWLPSYLG